MFRTRSAPAFRWDASELRTMWRKRRRFWPATPITSPVRRSTSTVASTSDEALAGGTPPAGTPGGVRGSGRRGVPAGIGPKLTRYRGVADHKTDRVGDFFGPDQPLQLRVLEDVLADVLLPERTDHG